MSKDKREASLEKIRSSKSTRVTLISFKAGSTGKSMIEIGFVLVYSIDLGLSFSGLNLTACNNVILVDLWWNPALEVWFRFCDRRGG
jgi:hypothetical protein